MSNIFNKVQMRKPKRSKFDLSHDVKMSFNMGELVPTCAIEVLPGDYFEMESANMLRFAPLVSPVMHRVRVRTDYFFVPNRLTLAEWPDFISGNVDIELPYISNDEWQEGSLADYLGFPPGSYSNAERMSAFPLAAYTLIWDEYYRHQDLQDKRFNPLVPGANGVNYSSIADNPPFKRGWRRDYLTSCLPAPQKGQAVSIPLTFQEDIPVDYEFQPGGAGDNAGQWRNANDGTVFTPGGPVTNDTGPSPLSASAHVGGTPVAYDPNGTLNVDIQSEAADINTLRWAFRMQEWLEKNARAGTRYIESILSHFGVRSSDARLQRPEFIGSTKGNMIISEVLSTTQSTTEDQALGQMGGHGLSVNGGNKFHYRAEEHGWIIGIISVMPDTAYQQGIPRKFSRKTRFDYAWPEFAELGEQEVYQREVYAAALDPDAVFGYISRYSEYKHENSRVAGAMRNSLAFWHLSRIFTANPELNSDFIECNPDDRIFSVVDPSVDKIYAHIFNNIYASRPLPRYGIPQI